MPHSLVQRLRPPLRIELPARHLGLKWRPTGAQDGPGLQKLILKSEVSDNVLRYTDSTRLAHIVGADIAPQYQKSIVGTDKSDRIQAVGAIFIDPEEKEKARAELFAVTATKWRGRGIGRALLTWQLEEARQMLVDLYGADSTIPAQISNVVEGKAMDRRRLYMAAGFSRVGQLTQLSHDLTQIPKETLPPGFKIVPLTFDYLGKIHQYYESQEGSIPATSCQRERWWQNAIRRHDSKLSFLVLDPQDEVVAYAITAVNATAVVASSQLAPVIEILQVEVDYRHQGLDRALVSKILEKASLLGVQSISVDTYANADTSFVASMEELGFTSRGTRLIYAIEV